MVDAEEAQDGTRAPAIRCSRRWPSIRGNGNNERGDVDTWRRRHAEYFATWTEEGRGPGLVGPDEVAWRTRKDVELDNLRATVTWALDRDNPDDVGLALRIAARLSGAGPQARLNSGVVANADRLLARATDADPGFEGAILAGLAADALFIDGDLAQAEKLAHQALARGTGDSSPLLGAAAAYSALIFGATARGRFDDAREVVVKGMRRFETDHTRSYFEYHATRIELTAGDAAAARRHAEEAVSLARRAEFPARLAQALCMLGQVTVCADPRTARAALDEISRIEQSSAFLAGQGMYNPLFVKVRLCQAEQDSRSALDALHDAAARRASEECSPRSAPSRSWPECSSTSANPGPRRCSAAS